MDDNEVLIVGPGINSQNECLVVGTACLVLDAWNPPTGLALPLWVDEHVDKHQEHRALVLLQDPHIYIHIYIGGGRSLLLARQNGHSFVRCPAGSGAQVATFRHSTRRREASRESILPT